MGQEKKHRWVTRAAKSVASGLIMLTPTVWLAEYTNYGRTMPGNDDAVCNTDCISPLEEQRIVSDMKVRFVDVVAAYNHRDGKKPLRPRQEIFAREKLAHYELLEESHGSNSFVGNTGFYGALFRDTTNGKIILTLAGVNFNANKAGFDDFDDALVASAGGIISQQKDARAFAEMAIKKYGKVDYLTGHSLGAYNALFLKGMGLVPGAECFLFDSPGVTRTMTHHMAELSGLPLADVQKNLRDGCYSYTNSMNSWNTRGTQNGYARTHDNTPDSYTAIFPRNHVFGDDFLDELAATTSLKKRENNQTNGAPEMVSLIFLLGALSLYSMDIARGAKRGAKHVSDKFTERMNTWRGSNDVNAGPSL